MQDLHQLDSQLMLNNYGRFNVSFERGEGSWIWDKNGEKYLDFISGIAVNALGHSPQIVKDAVVKQMDKYIHLSNLFPIESQLELAKVLLDNSNFDKAFFCNTGTEANEAAIKFVRKYWSRKLGSNDKVEIITFNKSFHGRTYGGLAATGQESMKQGFGPMLDGFIHVDWNDVEQLRNSVNKNTAAIMLEPMIAEGGLISPNSEFVAAINELKSQDILVIADEVQVALGRLGTLWGCEKFGLKADLITLAKPFGGGFPLGGVLMTEEISSQIQPGDHGSTFGGNPISCAVGVAVVNEILSKGFLESVNEKAKYLDEKLQEIKIKHEIVQSVKGVGLLRGLEIDGDVISYINACRDKGLLILRAGSNVLRIIPPLNVSFEEIDFACQTIDKVLEV